MIVYAIMFFLLIIGYIVFGNRKNGKKKYCVFCSIILILISSLRKETLGFSDTVHLYIPAFKLVQNLNFSDVFYAFRDTEYVFYYFTKIFTLFSTNINLYLSILSIPVVVSASVFIYKYSKHCLLSYLMFLSLNYFFLSFITLRHSLALSILIFAFMFLLKGKNKYFFIMIAVASLFHKTALIFALAYPISKMKPGLKNYLLIFISLFLVVFFKNQLFNWIFTFISDEHYLLYLNRNITINLNSFFINLALVVFYSLFRKKNDNDEKNNNIYLNMLCVGTAFSSLTIMMDVMYRISLYFTFPSIILIPNIIESMELSFNKKLFKTVITLILICYCFLSTLSNLDLLNYHFFWE